MSAAWPPKPSPRPAPAYDVVAIAASAGGLHALSTVLAALPERFPAAILVVQHLVPEHPSLLAGILDRRTPLPVVEAAAGTRLAPGRVYVAPPNRHLLVHSDLSLELADTARVQFVRPAADVLFASVAEACGRRAIAVVLTGMGRDGQAGVRAIKLRGGRVIAQDAATSEYGSMPAAAVSSGSVDLVLPLGEIAPALQRLMRPEREETVDE